MNGEALIFEFHRKESAGLSHTFTSTIVEVNVCDLAVVVLWAGALNGAAAPQE
jgi:hypothetical protein